MFQSYLSLAEFFQLKLKTPSSINAKVCRSLYKSIENVPVDFGRILPAIIFRHQVDVIESIVVEFGIIDQIGRSLVIGSI